MSKKEKPSHSICIVERYEVDGEQQHKTTRVGSAWLKRKGAFSCQLKPHIALTGSFMLFENKDDDNAQS